MFSLKTAIGTESGKIPLGETRFLAGISPCNVKGLRYVETGSELGELDGGSSMAVGTGSMPRLEAVSMAQVNGLGGNDMKGDYVTLLESSRVPSGRRWMRSRLLESIQWVSASDRCSLHECRDCERSFGFAGLAVSEICPPLQDLLRVLVSWTTLDEQGRCALRECGVG